MVHFKIFFFSIFQFLQAGREGRAGGQALSGHFFDVLSNTLHTVINREAFTEKAKGVMSS